MTSSGTPPSSHPQTWATDRADVELPPLVDVDADFAYQPDPYREGDLEATYALTIVGGTWQTAGAPPDRRALRLAVDGSDIEVSDGYELALSMQDTATATTDDGTQARTVTEGQITRHTIDADTKHPDLVFHLPPDTERVEIELSPNVQFTRTDDDSEPATGVVQLPTASFPVTLVDE